MVTLEVIKGEPKGMCYTIDNTDAIVIGRSRDCRFVVSEATVSRYHCIIDCAPLGVVIRDFGSANGTILNGRKIGSREIGMSAEVGRAQTYPDFPLKDGDILSLGADCEIHVKVETQARDGFVSDSFLLAKLQGHINAKQGTNEIIAGYESICKLGAGGMGEVWLVRETASGRELAIKLILPKMAANQQMRARFTREADVHSQLDHKNIVKQITSGEQDDACYILMEYCDGGTVKDALIKSGGHFDVNYAVEIILQILDALIYAHGVEIMVDLEYNSPRATRGIVHRDIKPENIFLAGDPKRPIAKLADFGLAKAFETSGLSGHTRTGAKAGTCQFMPKQQVLDFKHSQPDVDCWAAAATLYYMLTGDTPKDFKFNVDPLYTALTAPVVPIRKRNPRIPSRLADVIDYALREEPEIGIRSAAELKRRIVGAL